MANHGYFEADFMVFMSTTKRPGWVVEIYHVFNAPVERSDELLYYRILSARRGSGPNPIH
jgi:hypothetical protein